MMKAFALGQHLLRLGDNVAVDGDDRFFSSKEWPTNLPAWLASFSIRRAPWMPLSVIGFSA